MTGADPRLTTHQRNFVVKAFCKTENNSETCRLFERKFERAIKRDAVVDIIQKCDDACSTEEFKSSCK